MRIEWCENSDTCSNCKNIDNYQCSALEKVFQVAICDAMMLVLTCSMLQCDNGLCQNITSVYSCQFNSTANETYDCTDRRNCISITGLFYCQVSLQCFSFGTIVTIVVTLSRYVAPCQISL